MKGEELKELREKHNLTQKEVAEAIGTREQRISEWENGKKNISPAYQKLIQNFFSSLMLK